jgi:hypothetical protein
VKKYDIAEIEPERRNGYAWYGTWPARLPKEHAAWKAKLANERGSTRCPGRGNACIGLWPFFAHQ